MMEEGADQPRLLRSVYVAMYQKHLMKYHRKDLAAVQPLDVAHDTLFEMD
jgi:hypothetical protein